MKLICLFFLLAKERYAHPVDSIREIMRYVTPIPVQDVHEEVLGVLNVCGEIVTVISADGLLGLAVDAIENVKGFQDENKIVFQDFSDGTLISGTIQHKKKLHILLNLTEHSEKHAV